MSEISFIHLSDIHFVKSSNNPTDIDNDLREAILTDLEMNAKKSLSNISGILVTGDIAFSGNRVEYDIAKEFLGKICKIFNIKPSDVYCVPGNHDVNQKTINDSALVSYAQNAVDEKNTLDSADNAFKNLIDQNNFDVLFKPLSEYNEFAKRFECDISSQNIFWEEYFDLEENFKLRLVGINSSFLSNKNDHQRGKEDRLMYVGQVQIPKYKTDAATLLMCHHPPQCWKFKEDILQRINKRTDIQLYGHMHSQSIEITKENAILYSGAVHPTRTVDWLPRYNWLKIGGKLESNERILQIDIYPRALKSNRDSFAIDDSICETGKNSISHEINIDQKHKLALEDPQVEDINEANSNLLSKPILAMENNFVEGERKIIYDFYELSWLDQINILTDLCLLTDEDKYLSDSIMLSNAIKRAREKNRLMQLHNEILKRIKKD